MHSLCKASGSTTVDVRKVPTKSDAFWKRRSAAGVEKESLIQLGPENLQMRPLRFCLSHGFNISSLSQSMQSEALFQNFPATASEMATSATTSWPFAANTCLKRMAVPPNNATP